MTNMRPVTIQRGKPMTDIPLLLIIAIAGFTAAGVIALRVISAAIKRMFDDIDNRD